MVTAPPRDDLFLFRPSKNVVVIPDQLDVGLVRIRPSQAEIDLGHRRWSPVHHHFGQGNGRFGAVTHVGMVIRQLMGLRSNCIGNFRAPVSDIHTVQPGEGIQQLFTVTVLDVNTLGAGDHPGRSFTAPVFCQVGGRVKKVFAIPFAHLVVMQHAVPSYHGWTVKAGRLEIENRPSCKTGP